MTTKIRFPSIANVANDLRVANSQVDASEEGCDVRLQVYEDGQWAVRVGSSDYDQDHRGFWGASCVPGGGRRFKSTDIAKDLIDQAKDQAAQDSAL